MRKLMIVLMVAASFGVALSEEVAPFQYGIIMPNFALEPSTNRINGWVTGIWTENPQSALSTSFFNGSTGDSKGLSVGLVNYAYNYSGAQFAILNYVSGDFAGFECGGFNYVRGMCKGFQLGFYNIASEMRGVQLGLINTAENIYGVQVGLMNINVSNKFFSELPAELAPGMLILNWKF